MLGLQTYTKRLRTLLRIPIKGYKALSMHSGLSVASTTQLLRIKCL